MTGDATVGVALAAPGGPAVIAEDVTLGYRTAVVERLSFRLEVGQLACLIGPNGAGKSTVLRALAGNLVPRAGRLAVFGSEPHRLAPGVLARRLSLVLQERPADLGIRVRELVALGRLPHTDWLGSLSATDHAAIDRALAVTETADFAARRLSELSDGERARVFVARALAQDTPLLLLDEPTAHLDWPHRIALAELLRTVARQYRKAVLVSTHELELAFQMADAWLLLSRGRRPVFGAPEQLALEGQLSAAFGDDRFVVDAATGRLQMRRSFARSIGLVGQGEARAWTARALERAGFAVHESDVPADAPHVAVIGGPDAGYAWIHDGQRYDDILGLIQRLTAGGEA